MTGAFRCASASQEMGEPLAGTGSTVRAFLLVQAQGPWGRDALRDSRLPDEVKRRLRELQGTHGVRPLLIRAHGRRRPETTRIFAAYVDPVRPWVETTVFDDPRALLDLDLTGLRDGRSPGLSPHDGPLFLVCTHGRHDACCAERGRPLCAALHQVDPDHTWEVSHIGGDRFAANLLVLPHGLYYGRVEPTHAEQIVTAHRSGRLDLAHLRGRSSYPFALQAAEVFLRRHTGDAAVEPFAVLETERVGADTRVVFSRGEGRWSVSVSTERSERRQLTCRAVASSAAPVHTLGGISAI